MVDIKELKKLVKVCREMGIISIEKGDFKLNLAAASLFPAKPSKEPQEELKDKSSFTDEEILMWSASGIPEGGN